MGDGINLNYCLFSVSRRSHVRERSGVGILIYTQHRIFYFETNGGLVVVKCFIGPWHNIRGCYAMGLHLKSLPLWKNRLYFSVARFTSNNLSCVVVKLSSIGFR